MQVAQILAGYSLGQADILRRAMGKKKPEEMARQREVFVAGARTKEVGAAKANEIFDLMAHFAGYGFNKSHSAAYAVLTFQTAYLKRFHPTEVRLENRADVGVVVCDENPRGGHRVSPGLRCVWSPSP